MKCIWIAIFGFLATQVESKETNRCVQWTQRYHSAIISGHALDVFYPEDVSGVLDLGRCKQLCDVNTDCHLISYSASLSVCTLYLYTMDEVETLEYIVNAASNLANVHDYSILECHDSPICTCCLRGDPYLSAFKGHEQKIGRGLFEFSRSDDGEGCVIESKVLAVSLDPVNHPKRVTISGLVLTVRSAGAFSNPDTIVLHHTRGDAEVPTLYINDVKVGFPVTPTATLRVTEHEGTATISFNNCNVRLTFADFRHSKTCLDVPKDHADVAAGLCGNCNQADTAVVIPDDHLYIGAELRAEMQSHFNIVGVNVTAILDQIDVGLDTDVGLGLNL